MKSIYKLLLTIVIGSAVFVGGFFYYKQTMSSVQKQMYGDDKQYIVKSQTKLPDFVEVYEKDGQRRLKNTRDGYDIALEPNWRPEYYTNVVTIITDDQVPSGELTASFDVIKNKLVEDNLDAAVVDWLKRQNDEYCPNCYKVEKKERLTNVEVIVIKDYAALGEYFTYLFVNNGNVYELWTENMNEQDAFNIIKQILT